MNKFETIRDLYDAVEEFQRRGGSITKDWFAPDAPGRMNYNGPLECPVEIASKYG